MAIYSCKDCVAPKRHPGCHGHCPEYLEEKARHDEQKAEADKKRRIEYGLDLQYIRSIRRANNISRKKG
jgi:hypothetical protein